MIDRVFADGVVLSIPFLSGIFEDLDVDLCCSGVWGNLAGTTMSCVVMNGTRMFLVNIGDSRSISTQYTTQDIPVVKHQTVDHNLANPFEFDRLMMKINSNYDSGYFIKQDRIYGYHNGFINSINISRTLGDGLFKKSRVVCGKYSPSQSPLISKPDITVIHRNPALNTRISISSDGITLLDELLDGTQFDNYKVRSHHDNSTIIRLWIPCQVTPD